jgi:hypothetical protein
VSGCTPSVATTPWWRDRRRAGRAGPSPASWSRFGGYRCVAACPGSAARDSSNDPVESAQGCPPRRRQPPHHCQDAATTAPPTASSARARAYVPPRGRLHPCTKSDYYALMAEGAGNRVATIYPARAASPKRCRTLLQRQSGTLPQHTVRTLNKGCK